MSTKSIFASKTLWFNVASAAVLIIQSLTDAQVLSVEAQAAVNILGNILLRYVTTQPVSVMGTTMRTSKTTTK